MRQRTLQAIGITTVVMLFMASILTATFLLTGWLYQKINYHPPVLLAQIINAVLGLLFCFLFMTGLSFLFRNKGWAQQMRMFSPIIEAIQKITKGDFNVQLDNTFPDHEPLGELVKSVNTMAVELNQMEQMRQEFISNVSHEIQSPLTSIRGFAQALQNSELSRTEQQHYVSIIETESTRLSRLTENLLRLASLDAAQVKFEPKPYRLDKQIRNLILACEPQWANKNLEMDVAVDEVMITADEDLLSQVWVNLLHNSIKFTPDAGRICISLCQCAEKAEFRIADTGIGIASDDQPRIFERFFKADKARNRALGGSGLGLSIAKKVVEMHQGDIKVESALAQGTTFTVALPLT
ncbi:MAG: HAMP domain-containing sensor histidine kinase [Caldilineaceae bacterium]